MNNGTKKKKQKHQEETVGISKREIQEEERECEDWALKQDNSIVRRKKYYSSVMLCSMGENPMRINLSPRDECFTRRNIPQITSHHSDLHLDMSPNLHKTASFLCLSLSCSGLSSLSSFSVYS